jgi:hypothetical protein
MEELWHQIYDLNYEISNFGNIRNLIYKNLLKFKISNGYRTIYIQNRYFSIHRLVALYFVENPQSNNIVNHVDGDKTNNHFTNLEWTTQQKNVKHSVKNGLISCFEREVWQYSLDGTLLQKYKSVTEAAFIMGCSRRLIDLVCKKSPKNKTAKGYIWKYPFNPETCDLSNAIDINGFEFYKITIDGDVYSKRTRRKLKLSKNANGYLYVQFSINNKKKNFYIHQLVAKTFIENPEEKRFVNHKDFNKQNNHISNLEWCSHSENIKHFFSKSS